MAEATSAEDHLMLPIALNHQRLQRFCKANRYGFQIRSFTAS